MAFDYTKSAATASRLIQKFGQSFSCTAKTGEVYDPSTGTVVAVETAYTAQGVWLDYNNDEIDGQIVQMGDAKVLIDTSSREPKVDDTLLRNNKNWRMVNVKPLSPAGVDVMYEVQVRR